MFMGQAMPMWGQGKSPPNFVANLIQENNEGIPRVLRTLCFHGYGPRSDTGC